MSILIALLIAQQQGPMPGPMPYVRPPETIEELTLPGFNLTCQIYVGGGVADVPAELLHTLNEGGRWVVVLGQKRLMHATLITRKGNEYPRKMLFETSVPALVEEQQLQKAEFEF